MAEATQSINFPPCLPSSSVSGDAAATTDKSLFKAPAPVLRRAEARSCRGLQTSFPEPDRAHGAWHFPGLNLLPDGERVFKAKSLLNKLRAVMAAEDFCCRREDFEEAWQKVGPMLASEGVLACSPKDQD